jgi:hypothetical protein
LANSLPAWYDRDYDCCKTFLHPIYCKQEASLESYTSNKQDLFTYAMFRWDRYDNRKGNNRQRTLPRSEEKNRTR